MPLYAYILIGVGAFITLFLLLAALQPSAMAVTRTGTIAAPASAVFPHVNDFHLWAEWSPWEKLDPAMTKSHEGPPAGVGAAYSWTGNNKVGAGKMTILDTKPNAEVRIKLEFFRPMKAVNDTEFTFAEAAGVTTVTWTMTGKKNFMFKAFGLLMNIDKMIGKDFERGLASMKAAVEGAKSEAKLAA